MTEVVGREDELRSLRSFAEREGFGAVVLEGEAGIGKSTLWRAGVDAAHERGLRVLESRPAEAERGFAYATLGDLLEAAIDDVVGELAPPRRRALESALALADDGGAPVDPRTLAVAVRNALEALAAHTRVLVAIDDVQWLDASSAAALAFALRRMGDENILVLAARRLGEPVDADALDYALPAERVERVRVGPLSLGATQRLVQSQLGATFARPTLLRVHDAAGGNPFYAVELARALTERAAGADPTRPLPVPDSLEGLLRTRLEGLPAATRDALLLAAAQGRASPALLRAAGVADDALDAAVNARVIEVNGTVRFAHPLLASVLYQNVSGAERRNAHRRLADVVTDRITRARHLALATAQPDADVAATVEHAAQHAATRGAIAVAAELGEHALRLTPAPARGDRHRRALAAARAHLGAGEMERARILARDVVDASPEGIKRSEALLVLADVDNATIQETIALRREALRHAAGHPAMEASIHRGLALYVRFVDSLAEGEKHARVAVELAERCDDDALRAASLATLALLRFNGAQSDALGLGRQGYDLAVASGDAQQLLVASFNLAHVLVWSMRLDEARSLLEQIELQARDRDERAVGVAAWYLSLVDLRAGRWAAAADRAERARGLKNLYANEEVEDPTNLFPLALVAAHRGDLERARELARHGRDLATKQGALLAGLEATTGLVDLWGGDPARAVDEFLNAEEKAERAGWKDPSLCWWRTEYVEALVEVDRVDDAVAVLDEFEALATRLERTWALAHAARCRGLVAAARGDVETAAQLLEKAVEQHDAAGDPFGRARSLLALGVVRRRARQKRGAQDAIETALAGFEALGAAGWAERARSELGRISGRRRDEGLTPAERRVAALVAEGRTNREVAAALFLGERTVESHLSRVYAKLGVRSRTELASKFRGSHDFKESPAP